MFEILRIIGDCQAGEVETILFGDCYSGGIWGILAIVLDIMTVLVGVLAILGIVISGFQYMTASGDPGQITKAKKRIIEVVIGLVAYALMYLFLSWLIPGKMFSLETTDSSVIASVLSLPKWIL